MATESEIAINYLSDKPPETWHQAIWGWNWDAGLELPKWILSQPNCDKGTALLIYWYLQPFYYTKFASAEEVSSYQLNSYLLVKEVQEKYLSGFFQEKNICFNPKSDLGTDWTDDHVENSSSLPIVMYQPTPGIQLERIDIDEVLPWELFEELRQ